MTLHSLSQHPYGDQAPLVVALTLTHTLTLMVIRHPLWWLRSMCPNSYKFRLVKRPLRTAPGPPPGMLEFNRCETAECRKLCPSAEVVVSERARLPGLNYSEEWLNRNLGERHDQIVSPTDNCGYRGTPIVFLCMSGGFYACGFCLVLMCAFRYRFDTLMDAWNVWHNLYLELKVPAVWLRHEAQLCHTVCSHLLCAPT